MDAARENNVRNFQVVTREGQQPIMKTTASTQLGTQQSLNEAARKAEASGRYRTRVAVAIQSEFEDKVLRWELENEAFGWRSVTW